MTRSRRIVVALFVLLAVALAVGAAVVWESFQPTVIDVANPVHALALSRDGTQIAACGADLSWIYTTRGRERRVDAGEPPLLLGLAFSEDDTRVYALDPQGKLRAWSSRDGLRVEVPPCPNEGVMCEPALSPRGDLVATLDEEARVQLWTTSNGVPRRSLVRKGASGLDTTAGFSPSGELVYVWGQSDLRPHAETFAVWSLRTGTLVNEGPTHGDITAVLDPGELYVAGTNDSIEVRELRTGLARYSIPGPWAQLAVSRDGALLAVAFHAVKLHSLEDGRLVRELAVRESDPCSALAFSGDGTRLAAAFGRRIHVWRLRR